MADGLEHPLHLAVPAFVDRQLERVRREAAHLRRGGDAVVELDAAAKTFEDRVVRFPSDLGEVDLLDAVAAMREMTSWRKSSRFCPMPRVFSTSVIMSSSGSSRRPVDGLRSFS